MHFSIPETEELSEGNTTYTVYNVNVNGVFHCAVRYSQLHNFHEELKKECGESNLPPFPPKKLKFLSLSGSQQEGRRVALERYIQLVSQDQRVVHGDTFNSFFLRAQQESRQAQEENVSLDVHLMNGQKISVKIVNTDKCNAVLEKVMQQIGLSDDFVYYFGLFLVRLDDSRNEVSIVRRLQHFESPFLSVQAAITKGQQHRIVIRKCYWDPSFDDDLINDRIAMNLIYVQAISDVEKGWIVAPNETLKQLATLQSRGSKKEYLRLVRTLKYYGFIHFKACICDYPDENSKVLIAAGNKELNFRIQTGKDELKEGTFRVTRMRCWRITTGAGRERSESEEKPLEMELAFEYLMSKDKLIWVRVKSQQAILISMCLQGMVDELLMKKSGSKIRRPADSKSSSSGRYLTRDGTLTALHPDSGDIKETTKKPSEKATTAAAAAKSKIVASSTNNTAFDKYGDDDL